MAKLRAILGEFDRVDELSEVQFCLGVAANLLFIAKQPDPELYLAHYVETDLRLRPGLYSRSVCDKMNYNSFDSLDILALLMFTDEEHLSIKTHSVVLVGHRLRQSHSP